MGRAFARLFNLSSQNGLLWPFRWSGSSISSNGRTMIASRGGTGIHATKWPPHAQWARLAGQNLEYTNEKCSRRTAGSLIATCSFFPAWWGRSSPASLSTGRAISFGLSSFRAVSPFWAWSHGASSFPALPHSRGRSTRNFDAAVLRFLPETVTSSVYGSTD